MPESDEVASSKISHITGPLGPGCSTLGQLMGYKNQGIVTMTVLLGSVAKKYTARIDHHPVLRRYITTFKHPGESEAFEVDSKEKYLEARAILDAVPNAENHVLGLKSFLYDRLQCDKAGIQAPDFSQYAEPQILGSA